MTESQERETEHYEGPDSFYQVIAARIKVAREAAKMTQSRLAREVDVTPSAIANYEQGTRRPSLWTLVGIAHATGRQLEWFIERDYGKRASLTDALRHLAGSLTDAAYLPLSWTIDISKPDIHFNPSGEERSLPFPPDIAEGARLVCRVQQRNGEPFTYYLINPADAPDEHDLVLARRPDDEEYFQVLPFAEFMPRKPYKERYRLTQAVILAEFKRIRTRPRKRMRYP